MKRRRYLAATTAALVAGAGCLGNDRQADGDIHRTATAFDVPLWLGADPEAADSLIVGFEDPSCSICASFHSSTLPELRDDPLGDGVAFVYRPFPIRPYAWGTLAAEAVVATADRSRETAWSLVSHYYTNQSGFDEANVLDRTESFLDSETPVDSTEVASEVEDGIYADAVASTIEDGEDAGATTTPTFFLFDDGELRTEVTGNQDAAVFRNALQR